ncbi:endolytic transglycosylase MltG [Alkaliphilus pronyensis]|uniref:Endolytic transglycosylase MltG n=1 Tax=Alkaliphilus pronyensis TaxID=1482732 RepID=A0A6I0F3D9_9FIRM|nr:hypothetical protein [Alkaliphilus pronyensis]KAB3535852.1 endolytic transglycosylase MltG [Alkaliphilus pronyensis]
MIGIGVGMILAASFNIVFSNNEQQSSINLYNQKQNELEATIANLKNSYSHDNTKKNKEGVGINREEYADNNNEEEVNNNQQGNNKANNNSVETDETIEQDYYEIYITKGMNSQEIAGVLLDIGAIESEEDFLNYSIKKKVTTKFRIGYKKIPVDSSYDDIISILTNVTSLE